MTERDQLEGKAAELANTARAILKSTADKLDVHSRELRDAVIGFDAYLEKFDVEVSRRVEPTETGEGIQRTREF